jgi:DNA-binding transcriptional ArsR family regulator
MGMHPNLDYLHSCASIHKIIQSPKKLADLCKYSYTTFVKANKLIAEIKVLSALAEPCRLEILARLLMTGPMDLTSLSQGLTQDFSVISRHCNILFEAGIVSRTKEGRNVIYAPNKTVVEKLKAITAQFENLLKKR